MRNLRPLINEMIITYLLLLFFTHTSTLSIGSTSDKRNVTKRDVTGDLFPDWVPFKNKHGDQLGEFMEVTKKKPKKRLALPANFVLKAQSDQEVDDYIDKGQDEASGDEYFDKKEWTNVAISDNAEAKKLEVGQADPAKIAEIDSIVNIITKKEANPILSERKINDESEEDERIINLKQTDDDQEDKDDTKSEAKDSKKESHKEEGDYEYDEKVPDKENTDKISSEQSENEAKKAKILDSVDDLKERHAEEQRKISEKVKEEEMFKEELERGNLRHPSREYDKYNNKEPVWRKGNSDYDEYDEKLLDIRDKYKIITKKSIKTTTKPPEILKDEAEINTDVRHEKISLFANPHAYLIKEEEEDTEEKTTTVKSKISNAGKNESSKKFSSRYAEAEPQSEERVRISLVPDEKDSKEGEPTLFFPKKRTTKSRVKSTTKAPDSAESETVQSKNRRTPAIDAIAEDSLPSAADNALSSSVLTKAPAADASPSASSTDKKEKKQPENFDFEKGKNVRVRNITHRRKRSTVRKERRRMRENTKTQKQPRATMIKRTTLENMTIMVESMRNTMTNPDTMGTIIMKSMARNMQSMKNPESIPRDTAQKEATTSTKRRNMKRMLSSLKRREIPTKRRSMEDITMKRVTRRVDISKMRSSRLGIRDTLKVIRDITAKEDLDILIRATKRPKATTFTPVTAGIKSSTTGRKQERSGYTTTAAQREQPTSRSSTGGSTRIASDRRFTVRNVSPEAHDLTKQIRAVGQNFSLVFIL